MSAAIIWTILWGLGLGALAYHKTSRLWTNGFLLSGALITLIFVHSAWVFLCGLGAILAVILLSLNLTYQRQLYLTTPFLKWLQSNSNLLETEKDLLEAKPAGWDAELFSGQPRWKQLLKLEAPKLTDEEQAFLEGPAEKLCRMIDNWEIHQRQDFSPKIWRFLKTEGFFGLIIPKQYGGKEFSALAHSEILAKIASKSFTVASTVATPNSLGPIQLLLKYGTSEQKELYLPKFATGSEVPCFALSGPEAGADISAIPDKGIICKGEFQGKRVLGISLNWNKHFVTLAPVATILGLAFKLYDPNHFLGDQTELGITCALIPTNLPGISIGQRHKPLAGSIQNGPTQGEDVFIPLDWIIGGPSMIGHGWPMLLEGISISRAISIPSTAAGMAKSLTFATGAYARIRRQFKQPIGHFEGIEEVLARMACYTYIAEAARIVTAASIDRGESIATLGAIIKYHLTERVRKIASDAIDIHGGKGIMLGPRNYTALQYQNVPLLATPEGGNILTRCALIFNQGAIQTHPFLFKELKIAKENTGKNILPELDNTLTQHIQHTLSNMARALWTSLTQIRWSRGHYIKPLNRASSAFAFLTDVYLIAFGAKLKVKEKISARLGDLLSMLYLASCVLKRYEDDGKPSEDKYLIDWIMQDSLSIFWNQVEELLNNFPNRWIGFLLRIIVMPLGKRVHRPSDDLDHRIAQLVLTPNTSRDRLAKGAYLTAEPNNHIGLLDIALQKILAAEKENANELQKREAEEIRNEVVMADHFEPQDF